MPATRQAIANNYRYRRFLRNLWSDSPDTVQTGWTDNGDGSYTCDGTNTIVVREDMAVGVLQDAGVYECSFDITAYTSGTFRIVLYGPDDAGVSSSYTAAGSYTERLTIDTVTAATANRIVLQSFSSFNGTVANVHVREISRP